MNKTRAESVITGVASLGYTAFLIGMIWGYVDLVRYFGVFWGLIVALVTLPWGSIVWIPVDAFVLGRWTPFLIWTFAFFFLVVPWYCLIIFSGKDDPFK